MKRARWSPGGNLLRGMYPRAEYEKDIHELYLKQRHELRHSPIGKLTLPANYAPGHIHQDMYKPKPARVFVSSRTAQGAQALHQRQRRNKSKRTSAAAPAQVETYVPGQAASSTAVPILPIQQYPPTYRSATEPRLRFIGNKNNKTKQI